MKYPHCIDTDYIDLCFQDKNLRKKLPNNQSSQRWMESMEEMIREKWSVEFKNVPSTSILVFERGEFTNIVRNGSRY